MYELFEHTADIGLRARAATLDDLLGDAARALFSVIVVNLADVRPLLSLQFTVAGRQPDELLHDWLAELLFTFETRRLLLSDFEVRVGDEGLTATARGEPIDPNRHQLDMEVKAITWHGLKVERRDDGWLAEVIVDI
jgi:SHS2 domain-containing protein